MQILITDSSLVRTRAIHVNRWQLVLAASLLAVVMMLVAGAIYHLIFVTAAREGWPLVSGLVKGVARDDAAQRERFMRENLDAIAQRVGEMQAKLVKLEALGERVTGLAGVKTDDLKALQTPARGGQGGPFVPLSQPSLTQLNEAIDQIDERADLGGDIFALAESRLFEAQLQARLVPSTHPVEGRVGSGFGFRVDPFTGRAALHTGLDFPSDVGTPILAAAGGIVVVSEVHPAYGRMIEIDHGNALITRYAHASKLLVKVGQLVKRGQKIAEVGTTGRSTGPHLHFEVLVSGVQQNPVRFLAGKVKAPTMVADGSADAAKLRSLRRKAVAAARDGTASSERSSRSPRSGPGAAATGAIDAGGNAAPAAPAEPPTAVPTPPTAVPTPPAAVPTPPAAAPTTPTAPAVPAPSAHDAAAPTPDAAPRPAATADAAI